VLVPRFAEGPRSGAFCKAASVTGSGFANFAGIRTDGGSGLVLLRPGRARLAAGGFLEAVTVAVHGQDFDVVGEPVEQSAG